MTKKILEADRLDELAASVGFSVKSDHKAKVSALLALSREKVMQKAVALPVEAPPALIFDPR